MSWTKGKWAAAFGAATLAAGCGPAGQEPAADNAATAETAAKGEAAPPELPAYDPNRVPGMARIENRGYVLRPNVWSNPNIPVCWDNPDPGNEIERGWVRQAVQASWEAHSRVRFFGWSRCGSQATGIRIRIADEGPHTLGLGIALNRKPAGMLLNFTFATWKRDCAETPAKRELCIRSIAVHEFGHALAFAHEQNRPDTPGECTQPRQGSRGDEMLTPWDLDSVMNYCNPVYANDGRLSEGDIASVRRVYGA
jgi:hypothetical protein